MGTGGGSGGWQQGVYQYLAWALLPDRGTEAAKGGCGTALKDTRGRTQMS